MSGGGRDSVGGFRGRSSRESERNTWKRNGNRGKGEGEKGNCMLNPACFGGDTHGMSWRVSGDKGRSGSKDRV